MCVCISTVVVVCHSQASVMQRFLFRAQDRNMTNGDYVFFTFTSLYSATPTERPWVVYNIENEDVERRLKLFYAVKQVRLILSLTVKGLISVFSIKAK